jgi:hypothetical protein
MIDAAVARMAEGQKSFDSAPADHAARQGDAVLIDFEGKVDGTPFEGGKGDGMSVEIGSGRLIRVSRTSWSARRPMSSAWSRSPSRRNIRSTI